MRGVVIKVTLLLNKPRKESSWEEDKFLDYPNDRKIPGEEKFLETAAQLGSFARI